MRSSVDDPRKVFWVALVAAMCLYGISDSHADDYFWYYYPSPHGYLYVQDPIRYRTWEAQYTERQVITPGEDVQFPFSETIYFGFNSCEVGPQYYETVENIAALIAENEAIAVLGGHTDVRGEADVNVRYGFCRVSAVVELLESFGIPAVQLAEESYGAEHLAVTDAETEAQHARNRRVTVDFTIMTTGAPKTSTERVRAAAKWERRDYLGIWR